MGGYVPISFCMEITRPQGMMGSSLSYKKHFVDNSELELNFRRGTSDKKNELLKTWFGGLQNV